MARKNAWLLAAGHSALTVTPVGAHSRAAVLVSARSASLAALYSSDPMWALTPLRLHMLTRRQPRLHMRKRRPHRPERAVVAAAKPLGQLGRFFSTLPISRHPRRC